MNSDEEKKIVKKKTTSKKTLTAKKSTSQKKPDSLEKKQVKKSSASKTNKGLAKIKEDIPKIVVEENVESNEKSIDINEKEESNKKGKGKKIFILIIIFLVIIIAGILVYFLAIRKDSNNNNNNKPNNNDKPLKLPKPEVEDGERGKLGIDKNVNEKTIDKYLGRSDAVYRDMRMLEDPAMYEEIGGDRYLSGYIKGFEVVPLPYIIPVNNLPEEVGYTYSGLTLFYQLSDGSYIPMYKESEKILETLFPKDKIIFLMCGGGGYAGMMKQFLVSQGWDYDKIYVVGGYWYYNGKNKIDVPKSGVGDFVEYDFSNVPYHDIDFSELTLIKPDKHNKGKIEKFYLDSEYYKGNDEKFDKLMHTYDNFYSEFYKDKDPNDESLYDKYNEEFNKLDKEITTYVNDLLKNKKTFVMSVYNYNGCGDLSASVSTRAKEYSKKNNIYFYEISSDTLYSSDLYKDVKDFPNVIIVKDGKVYTYLELDSDEDTKVYDSEKELINWINKYIYVSK